MKTEKKKQVGVSLSAHKRVTEYARINGMKVSFVVDTAIKAYLTRAKNGESQGESTR